jgi:hypothetical protein
VARGGERKEQGNYRYRTRTYSSLTQNKESYRLDEPVEERKKDKKTDLEGIEPPRLVLKTKALPLCYKSKSKPERN